MNCSYSESLIVREIRETKEKEDELKRQRKKCGFPEDTSILMSNSACDSIKTDSTLAINPTVKSSSFLSNLDFFMSKSNGRSNESLSSKSSPRGSMISGQNLIYDSQCSISFNRSCHLPDNELKQMNNVVSQELNRFNDNGISIIRTSSTNGLIHRSSSNQNINSIQNTNNIIQREIEAIRAQEAELRQLGRIQHTSDEHADPRKYQEIISKLSKSQSINALSTGKVRRDSENQLITRYHGPTTTATATNGAFKSKTNNNSCKGFNSLFTY